VAIGLIFDAPGVTQAQYEQVRGEVIPGNRPAAGMLYHTGGPSENGWCVVEIWDSQESADRFFRDKLQQALQKAGISVQPRRFEVVNTIQS
jgi:hypothetical protein